MKDLWLRRFTSLLVGGLISLYLPPAMSSILVFGILLLLLVRVWYWKPTDFFGKLFKPEVILLGITLVIGYFYGLTNSKVEDPIILERIEVVGILKDWQLSPDKATGVFIVKGIDGSLNQEETGLNAEEFVNKKYFLRVYPQKDGDFSSEWLRIQPGDYLKFSAQLEQPKPIGTPTEFNLQVYYKARGISGTLTAKSEVSLIEFGKPPLSWKIRNYISELLNFWPPEQTGVLEGILFGDSSKIPEQIKEQYRITGVLHVFAASGSNVAFVAGMGWTLLKFFPPVIRVMGTSLLLILYAMLCGGNIPIVRATILGIAVLLGKLGRGKVASLRLLLFAGVSLFIFNPLMLKDVGFQLSFLAAWGIITLGPGLSNLKLTLRLPGIIRPLFVSTLGAQISTIPVLINSFHRVSIIGFFVNIIILFVLGSVLELGLIGVILSFYPPIAAPFFQASIWLLQISNLVLGSLSTLPWADVWVIEPGFLFWLIWYSVIAIGLIGTRRVYFVLKVGVRIILRKLEVLSGKNDLLLRLESNLKKISSIMPEESLRSIVTVFLILVLLISSLGNSKQLELVVIDVGQGDSILIRSPQKRAVLIDTGPRNDRYDSGERVVFPYLLNRGVKELDALILTHEHQDHTGGSKFLLENLKIGWIGVPEVGEQILEGEWVENLPIEALDKVKTLRLGDRIELDSGAWVEVISPSELLEGTNSDPNNNSLILSLNYMGKSILLTADVEQEGMQKILETRGANSDILKVPHHGSKYSLNKDFLNSIFPQAVVVSVGKNNFGHPHMDVLDFWEARNVPVYRTDLNGTIRIFIDHRGFEIITGRY